MSNRFGFVKGVGFSLAMFITLLVGVDIGEKYIIRQYENETEDGKDSVQDAEVEEN